MKYIAETNPLIFFKEYLSKVAREAGINTLEKFLQIDYLSQMLSGYVDSETMHGDSGDLIRLIDILKTDTESPHKTIEGYKKVADRILFYHSFFPEAFRKRLLNVEFYAKSARMFYRLVGIYQIPVCGYISEEYSLWNFVLNTARGRFLF
jgi:hypothetical protein